MGSLNRVQLIGNLGRDPELRYMTDGTPVCNFSIATTEAWTNYLGNQKVKLSAVQTATTTNGIAANDNFASARRAA